jgi:8-oxo-dGTP pyrophosphatase MutT (NUDIX family)
MNKMKKDFVVVAYIVKDGKVLLVHHRKLDRWLPVGGHIEEGETPEDTVFREAREEAGLDIEIVGEKDTGGDEAGKVEMLITPDHIQLEEIDGKHQHIDLVYFARAKSTNIRLKKDEHHEIRWFSEADLDSPEIAQNVRYFAKKAIRKLSG